MSREEIVNNIGYQLTRAAVDYVEKHEFADSMDCFEAGAEWMQKKMIDKACEILENVTVTYNRRFFGKCEENAFDIDFIKEFRQAMEK